MSNQLVKALYDYEASDTKVLSCTIGEKFVVIKHSKDWLYIVNLKGALGYIPASYVETDEVDDAQFLETVDYVISLLDLKHNDSNSITTRQVNHAQVKLTQLRCEIVQRLFKNPCTSPDVTPENLLSNCSSPDPALENFSTNCDLASTNVAKESAKVLIATPALKYTSNAGTQTEEKRDTSPDSKTKTPPTVDVSLPQNLMSELIERLRISTELSHEKCKTAIVTVIQCLGELIPSYETTCCQIIQQLENVESNANLPDVMAQSSDLVNLKAIFKKLWYCKDDEQQRSWPVHEDEEIISNYLQELSKILLNANPLISQEVIRNRGYDYVHMLVTYFQMETRRSLRMELYTVMLEIIRLEEAVIPNYLLNSVFPAALSAEMMNHQADGERWNNAALLFTAVFSTGHKPPINLFEHINENFILKLLQIIEGENSDGEKIDINIPMEASIPPILAFNLHFDDPELNLVLKALKQRQNVSQLTENLVSYLNWEEDPTRVFNILGGRKSHYERSNAVHKLLIEMFSDLYISKLFYYNDVRVAIDIIITHLNNLQAGDQTRVSYLVLALNLTKNTSYKEEPHKLNEFLKCLDGILNHECSSQAEKDLANDIKRLLSSITII